METTKICMEWNERTNPFTYFDVELVERNVSCSVHNLFDERVHPLEDCEIEHHGAIFIKIWRQFLPLWHFRSMKRNPSISMSSMLSFCKSKHTEKSLPRWSCYLTQSLVAMDLRGSTAILRFVCEPNMEKQRMDWRTSFFIVD